TVNNQLVFLRFAIRSQSANHVHVHHGHGTGQREERMLAVVFRTEESPLFATKGNKHEPAPLVFFLSEPSRYLDQSGRARAVLVSTVVNGPIVRVFRQAAKTAVA